MILGRVEVSNEMLVNILRDTQEHLICTGIQSLLLHSSAMNGHTFSSEEFWDHNKLNMWDVLTHWVHDEHQYAKVLQIVYVILIQILQV